MRLVQELSDAVVARARQRSLLLMGERPTTVERVATWFGAMQAQDAASGKWSLGIRVPGMSESDVDAAFGRAEVVRTWPMRGTLHIVPARDIRWMLELTATRALKGAQGRRQQLGLELADVERASTLIANALRDSGRLTRTECLAVLQRGGIATDGQRGYHLLGYAAQTGVICIGPSDGREQVFVLIDDWAPEQVTMTRDEALAELAFRFFRSHGPARLADFTGWAGLTLTDARAAVAANVGRLVPRRFRGEDAWVSIELAERIDDGAASTWSSAAALPGFDEFVLGYKDRSVQLAPGDLDRIVPGGNGVFRATMCLDGRVVGTWTRTLRAKEVVIEASPFGSLGARQTARINASFEAYGRFLGRPARLT
jgi:hypothetical protein